MIITRNDKFLIKFVLYQGSSWSQLGSLIPWKVCVWLELLDFIARQHRWLVTDIVSVFQLFSSRLIRCHSKCSHQQWPAWLKASTASDQVSSSCCWSGWSLFYLRHIKFVFFQNGLSTCFMDCWVTFADWAQLAPPLFSGFIPQINPPALESLLSDYAAHDQKLQMELSMNGFPRSVFSDLHSKMHKLN